MASAMTETMTEPVDLLAKFDPIIQTRERCLPRAWKIRSIW
jgi:hypothetical protein